MAPAKANQRPFSKKARPIMEALLPIFLFIVAVIAVNVYEFGRPD